MAGLGRKEWSPGDTLNAADVNGYLMDQSVMVFAGTAARASAIPSPSAGMVAYSTATQLQVYNGSAWVDVSTSYGSASGGTATSITVAGTAYTLLTFTSDGTLTVGKAGLFDVLVVGGGAGAAIGGGGAGGLLEVTTGYLTAGSQTVVVGAGGADGRNGFSSRCGTYYGVGGGTHIAGTNSPGLTGGSGGGGRGTGAGGSGTSGQGNNGGTGASEGGGGGGGANAVGSPASPNAGANGGAGKDISTFLGQAATTTYKGGGGGGGGASSGGAGGIGGGGAGSSGAGTAGTANSGGGGGGGYGGAAAAGGSGIVYVRFKV